MDAIRGSQAEPEDSAPTTELVTGVVGDRCANCQSPMAADQRYCLNCGERRGRARFSPQTLATQTAPAAAEPPVPPRHPRSRFSSGMTLVAGVATLLIALGVGVLIGHDSNGNSGKAPAAQVTYLNGGGSGAAGSAAAPSAASTPAAASSTGAHHAARKATVVHVTAKAAKAANTQAAKVLGSSNNLSHNVSQSVGGSCSGGAGCENGKFTGNFFPGG